MMFSQALARHPTWVGLWLQNVAMIFFGRRRDSSFIKFGDMRPLAKLSTG